MSVTRARPRNAELVTLIYFEASTSKAGATEDRDVIELNLRSVDVIIALPSRRGARDSARRRASIRQAESQSTLMTSGNLDRSRCGARSLVPAIDDEPDVSPARVAVEPGGPAYRPTSHLVLATRKIHSRTANGECDNHLRDHGIGEAPSGSRSSFSPGSTNSRTTPPVRHRRGKDLRRQILRRHHAEPVLAVSGCELPHAVVTPVRRVAADGDRRVVLAGARATCSKYMPRR
jgi:hypothetical protein